MKAFKKVLTIILYVLIILVFLVAVVFVISSVNGSKTGVPGAFGYTFNVVQTNSMEPTIMVGDIVIGKAVDAETTELKVGDIVTYKTKIQGEDTTKTHRISEVITTGSVPRYVTWGDNREVCPVADDGERTINDIQSVYTATIPKVGKFINFVKEPLGFILCVVLPLLAFIIWEVIDLIKLWEKVKKSAETTEALAGTDEAVKDAIIKEYLAKQAAEAAAKEEASAKDAPPSNSENNQN